MENFTDANTGTTNYERPIFNRRFFMEGLRDVKPNYDDLIQSWNKGCLELVDALVGYVPLTNQLCNAAAIACDFSFPGVFDYEVSSGFGRWFGEFILEHGGDEPSQKEAHAWLIKEIGAFFSQCATPEESETVKAAIRDAYFLNTQGVAK